MKEVKGLTRTVGGSVVGPSSVMGGVRGGLSNREFGGGLVTTGGAVGGYSEGHTRKGGGGQGTHWGEGTFFARWTLVEPGWLGTASGVRAASIGEVNSEGRDFINWHGSP